MMKNIAIMAALVIVILILRAISEKRITMPGAGGGDGPEPPEGPADGFETIEGNVDGVEYTADMYSDDEISVEIDLDEPVENTREIDVRGGKKPELDPADPLRPGAEALIAMGAEYIDVGYNADIVGAVFPASIRIDRSFAEKAVRHLIALREKAS